MNDTAQQLDSALVLIKSTMTEWGIDNYLGYRTDQTLRLSVDGATNLYDLINTLTGEIDRLEKIITYIETKDKVTAC